jgi:hypothetical protein
MIRSSPAGAPSRRKFIGLCPVVVSMVLGSVAAPRAMAQATPAPAGAAAPGAPAAAASAGTTSFKSIEERIKNAEPLPPADQQALAASIKDKVALLGSPNPGEQTRARTWLVSEASLPGEKPAKNGYVTAYGNAVSANVAPLTSSPDARVRLNAAIVVAETARVTGGIQLAPTAQALLNDKSEAVVLWGMKAARWIIPAQVRAGLPNTLANAVVTAVKNHLEGQVAGAIADEAYNAVTLDVVGPSFRNVTPDQAKTMAPFVLQLLEARRPLYVKGVPSAPRADATATRFLSDPKVFGNLPPAQQQQAMQAMSDIVALAAQQAQAANNADRAELATTVYLAGLAVATQLPEQMQAIQQASQQINNPATATAAQIASMAQAVSAALKGSTKFKLNDPPAVQANKPAPAPEATTGPVLIPGESATPAVPPTPATPVPPGTTPTTGPAGGPATKAGGATGAPKPPPPGGATPPHPTNAPKPGGPAAGHAGPAGATRPATPK